MTPAIEKKGRDASRIPAVASFYLAASIVGFFWHGAAQETNDIWRLDPTQQWPTLLWTPLVGVAFGLATVQAFRLLETRMAWLPELHREFQGIFGGATTGELFFLAFASSVGEELLFRGAMMDAWGLVPSSLIFALLHVPPRWSLWPWTVSSLVLGLALGGLTLLTGNLGAAVAAHFTINLINMLYITRKAPGMTLRGPVRPAGV